MTREACATVGARAGRAQRAAPGRARWEHVGDMPALRPTEGVAPPRCNGARPAGRASAAPGARAREGGVRGGHPLPGALGGHRAHGRGACGRDQVGGWD